MRNLEIVRYVEIDSSSAYFWVSIYLAIPSLSPLTPVPISKVHLLDLFSLKFQNCTYSQFLAAESLHCSEVRTLNISSSIAPGYDVSNRDSCSGLYFCFVFLFVKIIMILVLARIIEVILTCYKR